VSLKLKSFLGLTTSETGIGCVIYQSWRLLHVLYKSVWLSSTYTAVNRRC